MEIENKADRLDPFCGPPVQDNFGEAFFNDTMDFGEGPWGFGDPDGSSGPDTLLITPTALSYNKPRFLSEASTTSSPPSTLACPDLLSQAGQADCETKQELDVPSPDPVAGGQSQASCTDQPGASTPFSHSASPPESFSVQETPFPSASDTEFLNIDGIRLETAPRVLSHSTPTSPTVTRQSGDAFDIFASAMNTDSASHPPGYAAVDYNNVEAPRGRLAVPRGSSRAQSTNGLSAQPSRNPVPGPSFVRGSVENPFGNPNTAPMPPPREPRVSHEQATLDPQMGTLSNGMGHLGASEGLPKTPSPPMSSLADDFTWTVPELSPPFHPVEKQEDLWSFQGGLLGSEQFTDSTAAVRSATLDLAKLTDSFEHPGCEDYSHNPASDCLMPDLAMYPLVSRPRSQTTGVLNLPYSSPMMSQHSSLPSTPAQRHTRTPSIGARQMTPMSSPLRKVHTIRGVSTSPSPARGRLRVGEPGSGRSASTAGDSSVRKRRSPSRREVRMPLSSDKGGFVNFTPHDCETLMMGVAPSGSSKTKAKREREEHERRRRLEEAAMKAVAAAGGNVQFLTEASLMGA